MVTRYEETIYSYLIIKITDIIIIIGRTANTFNHFQKKTVNCLIPFVPHNSFFINIFL